MKSLTDHAKVGYFGNPNPHTYSSPAWYAHAIGQWFHATGRYMPTAVRMGRGYSIWANNRRFKIIECGPKMVTFEITLDAHAA